MEEDGDSPRLKELLPTDSALVDLLSCHEELSDSSEDDMSVPCSQLNLCQTVKIQRETLEQPVREMRLVDLRDAQLLEEPPGDHDSEEDMEAFAHCRVPQIIRTSRLKLRGVIQVIFEFLFARKTLSLSDKDFAELEASSDEVKRLAELIPVVLVVLQEVARNPRFPQVLAWWEESVPCRVTIEKVGPRANPADLKPWQGFWWWSFETWAMAGEVVSSFLEPREVPLEEDFLNNLKDLKAYSEGQEWKIPIMVAVLYTLRKSSWLWDLLV